MKRTTTSTTMGLSQASQVGTRGPKWAMKTSLNGMRLDVNIVLYAEDQAQNLGCTEDQ